MRIKIGKAGDIVLFDFSPVQAYKIAVKMEKNSIDFYQGLSKDIRDEEAGREISFLIEQEQVHLKTFQGLLDREKEIREDAFEEDDFVNYMNANIFDASQDRTKIEHMEHRHTALEEAMNLEKRSIVFYEGCLSHSKDRQVQKAFGEILEEEKKHLKKFADFLRIKCINSQKGCLL